jgi:hypothetical protein
MKKRIKSLSLNKETLRNLQADSLRGAVVGGNDTTSAVCFIPTGCECNTQDPACTLPPSACLVTCSCSH